MEIFFSILILSFLWRAKISDEKNAISRIFHENNYFRQFFPFAIEFYLKRTKFNVGHDGR